MAFNSHCHAVRSPQLRPSLTTKMLRVMRLTAIILLTASLAASATGFSQRVTLSLKNATLEQAFSAIEKQAGVSFIYGKKQLQQAHPINITTSNETLENVLELLFKDLPLTYTISGKYIAIKQKLTPVIARSDEGATKQSPPPVDIKGRLVNEKGEPVAGASVLVKGSKTQGTSTNANGEFELKDVDENATLVISGVSIETLEMKINGRTDLEMIRANTKVTEGESITIVSTGYQDIPKERATGSFYKVDNELLNRKQSFDIISRLENVTSGFQIYQNQISIRGRSTIFANRNPLIVVDNFPYDGDINNLNPNDIESVSILKDASAASIWGAFSGNGVIVIKTKGGKYNQPTRVSLNTNITIGNRPDLFFSDAFLPSTDFIGVEQFLFDKGYYNPTLNNMSTYPAVSPVVEILAKQRAGTITAADATSQIDALKGNDVRKEISKYFYQRSINQQYALNVSGGSSKAHYYMSAGYDKSRSVLVGNDNDRMTFNIQSTFRPITSLELSGGLNFNQSSQNSDNTLSESTTDIALGHVIYPYARFNDGHGNSFSIPKAYTNSYTQSMRSKGLLDWNYYPLNELGLNQNTSKTYDTRLNAGIKYTVLRGLCVEVKYQYLKSLSEAKELYYDNSFFVRNLVNRFTVVNSNGTVKKNIPLGAILNNYSTNLTSNSGRVQLGFDRIYGKHAITAIAGIDIRETKSNGLGNGIYGYDINTLTFPSINYDTLYQTLPNGTARIPRIGYVKGTLNRFRSYFANAAYTLKSRYTFSASGRIDQSNFFGYKANQRSVPLWSAGIKWDINKEGFYNLRFIPDLSIRATYGYNGNLDKTATPLTLAFYRPIPGGLSNLLYARIDNPGNPELTWERIAMLNIGIDFGIVNGRISGSIEYFSKKGSDMLGDDPIDPTTGFSNVRGNFTNMKSSGFDLVLNTKNIDRNFKWSSTFLFSHASNKVTEYKGTSAQKTVLEGKPVEGLYVNRWGGLDPSTGNPRGYLGDTLSANWATLNNLAIKDKLFIGSYVPTIFGAVLNAFSYKNISMSINISYKANYYFLRSSVDYGRLFSTWVSHNDYNLRWQKPGDEVATNVPSLLYPNNNARDLFYTQSETLVEKGDHIRIEDIRLAYNVDRSIWKKLPLQNIETFIYINNIGMIWQANDKGIDPNYRGGYLPPRTFSFGVKSTF